MFHINVAAVSVVARSGFPDNPNRDLIVEALMGVVGKSPNQRRGVRVKTSSSENLGSAGADSPSQQQVAAYIADICVELAHLLAMAQAEAAH